MPYVFGYGSLVDRDSLEASLGRSLAPSDGPLPLQLHGFRRAWNVVGHSSSRPDYVFTDADGAAWEGWVTFLGLEPADGALTPGAAWRLTDADIVRLDDRERSYDRVDVTSAVGRAAARVLTYVPRADVVARAAGLHDRVVMARYLRLVDRGFRSLGEPVHAEHLATFPPPPPVREIQVRPAVPGRRNEAVDPAAQSG